MLFLCIYSKKEIYYSLICVIFIMNIQHFKKNNNESKTIVYYLDEIKGQGEKGNKALKIFIKPESIDIPCLSLQFLLKTLKYQYKCQDMNTRNLLSSLATSFYTDSFSMFSKHSSKRKKYKNKEIYNFLYEIIKKDVSKKTQQIIDDIISSFTTKYTEYLNNKMKKKDKTKSEEGVNNSAMNFPIKDLDLLKTDDNNDDLNDSFSSCKSSKENKAICVNNQKKVCQTINKRRNIVKIIYKKIGKEDPFDLYYDEDNMYNSSINQTDISLSKEMFTKTNINEKKNKKGG